MSRKWHGAKMSIELYHGSNDAGFTGPSKSFSSDIFGGVFAGSEDVAAGHGKHIFVCSIDDDEILTDYALNYECDYSDVTAAINAELRLEGDQLELVVDAAMADGQCDDTLVDALSADNLADASWELQRLRGVIAAALGFKAVEMSDEHGDVYLVLPGTTFLPV